MALTRTPLKASSSPSALVSWMTPAFATAYAAVPLETPKPSTEATLTMAPPLPAANIRRAASCAQKNTASRSVPTTRRHSASESSSARPECATPALLTRMVTVPNAFSASSNARVIALRSRTSASIAMARPPAASMRVFSAARRSMRRATSATGAPSRASTSAKRTPSPLDAPVTSATRPLRLKSSAAVIRACLAWLSFGAAPPALDSASDAEDTATSARWNNEGFSMAQHDDHHEHGSELSETQLRVRALETVLTEKGYIDPAALDLIIEAYETKVGPHTGARIVAKAWHDPAFKRALLDDGSKAVSALGHESRVGDHLVAVENTPTLHNMIVCTLCSCYPWEVLGLPPVWYKSAPYRSRAVKDPRGVLADFGIKLAANTEIRVWDSTAETRFLVLPMRPAGTEGWSEERLAQLVTRDAMIGTGLAKRPEEVA